jgi:orotidine-5'-phosphate decarboxylase
MAEIIVALDMPTADGALSLVDRVGDAVSFYKVGPVLHTRAGPELTRRLRERGKRVFLDLKLHDIPNTVAQTVEAAAELGVDLLTLHTSGGTKMMAAARRAAGASGPRLLGVTLLTSFNAADVEEVWGKELTSLREEVARLAALAAAAELDGVVCSPLEVEVMRRRLGADFLVVTPGIRPAGGSAGDQARTATPAEAVRAGADFLVVGRPITDAADPVQVIARMREEMGVLEATA